MPTVNIQPLIEELLGDLKTAGAGFYNKVAVERRPILERSVARIAELSALRLTDPGNEDVHKRDLEHNYNILLSEAALAQSLAEKSFWDFMGVVLVKATGFFIRLIPPTALL